MREILFRAKRLDNGEWVEGFFSGETCDGPFSPMYEQGNIIKKGSGWWFSVDPATVGQFTGLLDKHGARIFEGDVVRAKYVIKKYLATVYGCVGHKNGSFVIEGEDITHYRWRDYEVEVIGNIHDNPELLEVTPDE